MVLLPCSVGNYKPGPPAVKITMKATIKAKIMAIMPLTVRLTYISGTDYTIPFTLALWRGCLDCIWVAIP